MIWSRTIFEKRLLALEAWSSGLRALLHQHKAAPHRRDTFRLCMGLRTNPNVVNVTRSSEPYRIFKSVSTALQISSATYLDASGPTGIPIV